MKYLILIGLLFSFHCSAIELGNTLQDFELPIWKQEETFKLQNAVKKKKMVINFWASWCTACINELAELEELKKKYANDYAFIGINAGEKKGKIKKFLKKYKFSYQILVDKNRKISKMLGVEELPRTLVLDQTGKIIFSGTRPPKTL